MHTQGHRQRLRERFLRGGEQGLHDYELLELLLFGANPRADMKPLAKDLLQEFGSLNGVMNAEQQALLKVKGVGETAVAIIKAFHATLVRSLREQIMQKPVISSWSQVLEYCQLTMAHLKNEQLRLLFLDSKNCLMADELQQTGTVNQTAIFPREVVKRALDLGASAMILVHNHPSGDPTPSAEDIEMTQRIRNVSVQLGIRLHDHVIVGKQKHVSMRTDGLL